MLVEVGDESSELTPVAFCAPGGITMATAEHSQAKHLFKALPAYTLALSFHYAKYRQGAKDNA